MRHLLLWRKALWDKRLALGIWLVRNVTVLLWIVVHVLLSSIRIRRISVRVTWVWGFIIEVSLVVILVVVVVALTRVLVLVGILVLVVQMRHGGMLLLGWEGCTDRLS
jgi:hypothetical protein